MLWFFYQVFFLAYEEVELYSSVSVDREPFKQRIDQLQQQATLIPLGHDTKHLHWDVYRDMNTKKFTTKTFTLIGALYKAQCSFSQVSYCINDTYQVSSKTLLTLKIF